MWRSAVVRCLGVAHCCVESHWGSELAAAEASRRKTQLNTRKLFRRFTSDSELCRSGTTSRRKESSDVTQMASGEPAGWANWGVLALRQRKLDDAAQRMERATKACSRQRSDLPDIGYLESGRGISAAAITDWRKAVELNPKNYRAAYQSQKKWSGKPARTVTPNSSN